MGGMTILKLNSSFRMGLAVKLLAIVLLFGLTESALLPYVYIYSANGDTLRVGEGVIADASLSYSASSNIIYYRFDFGEGEGYGVVSQDARASHTYTSPGNYKISFLLNDVNSTSKYLANMTSEEKSAPIITTSVTIFPQKGNYKYCARVIGQNFVTGLAGHTDRSFSPNSPFVLQTNKDYLMEVKICEVSSNGYDYVSESSISKSYASLGENPTLASSDWDVVKIIENLKWSADDESWRSNIKTVAFVGGASVVLTISGPEVTRKSSTVGSVSFSVSTIGPGSTLYGADSSAVGNTLDSRTISHANTCFKQHIDQSNETWVSELLYKQHICSANTGWALLKHSKTRANDSLGAIFLFSDSALDPLGNTIHDLLTPPPSNPNDLDYTLCAGLTSSQCNSTVVNDFTLLRRDALFLTTRGMMRVVHNNTDTSGSVFVKVSTGMDSIDNPDSYPFRSTFFAEVTCPMVTAEPDYVFLATSNQTYNGIGFDTLMYSNTDEHSDWATITLPSNFAGNSPMFMGAVRCDDLGMNVYLVCNSTEGGSCSLIGHVMNQGTDTFYAGFVFPPSTKMRGLVQHVVGGCHIIAYGDEVWVGNTGLSLMKRTAVVTDTDSSECTKLDNENEYFHNIISSRRNGGYTAITNHGRLYYGRLGVEHAIGISLCIPSYSNSTMTAYLTTSFDIAGNLHSLTGRYFDIISKGIDVSNGSIVSSDLGLTHVIVPVESLLDSDGGIAHHGLSLHGNISLVPHIFSPSTIRFRVMSSIEAVKQNTANDEFLPEYVQNMVLNVKSPSSSYTNDNDLSYTILQTGTCTPPIQCFDVMHNPTVKDIAYSAAHVDSNDLSYRWHVENIRLPLLTAEQASALKFALSVTYTGNSTSMNLNDEVMLELLDSSSTSSNMVQFLDLNSTGWTSCDVGRTVELGGFGAGSVLLYELTNASHARGVLSHAGWGSTTAPESGVFLPVNGWRMYDIREFGDIACTNPGQKLRVFAPSEMAETKSLIPIELLNTNTNSFAFDGAHVGYIVTISVVSCICSSRIEVVENATHIWVSPISATFPSGDYSVSEWSVVAAGRSTENSALTRSSKWSIHTGNCTCSCMKLSVDPVNSDIYSNEHYIDIQQSLSLFAFSSPISCSIKSYLSAPGITVASSNSAVIEWKKSPAQRKNLVLDNTLGSGEGKQSIIVNTVVSPSLSSCEDFEQFTVQRLRLGCPPTKRVEISWPFTELEFLSGNPVFSDGSERLHTIPINYRPPSSLGIAIPVSDRFYAANPSLPKYRNTYKISQNTGKYYDCSGKAVCTCTDQQRVSMKYTDSECLLRAPKTSFSGGPYVPAFSVVEEQGEGTNRKTVVLSEDLSYRVTELNGRIDWCINTTVPTCAHTNVTQTELTQLRTSLRDGISFTGSELYHFKIIVEGITDCTLTKEIVLWVYDPPYDETVVYSVVGIVAVLMAMAILFEYFHFSGSE